MDEFWNKKNFFNLGMGLMFAIRKKFWYSDKNINNLIEERAKIGRENLDR